MITSLYDQHEANAIREEWSRERSGILDMQPAPKCRISRYRSAQLVRYITRWDEAITHWRKFRNEVELDIYWYDLVSADYQSARTERLYIGDILRRRGFIYLGNGQWVDPLAAAELDKTDGWEQRNIGRAS